jgi:hypothetical protein
MIIVTGFIQLGFGHTDYFTWEGTETDPSKIGRQEARLTYHQRNIKLGPASVADRDDF